MTEIIDQTPATRSPYQVASDAINAQIRKAAGYPPDQELEIIYSASNLNETNCPIDNLSDIAVDGVCVLSLASDGWNEETTEFSEPMMNPTWLQVAVFCDRAIKNIGMGDHRFLENVYKSRYGKTEHNGHHVYTLMMGS